MFERIDEQAKILLDQLALGLDFFGKGFNYVTLLRPEYYTRVLDAIFLHAASIERSYTDFFDEKQSADGKLSALNSSMQSVRLALDEKRQQIEDWESRAIVLQQDILAMRVALNDLWVRLHDASQRFKEAVRRSGNGCSFSEVLAVGASVAVAVGTGGTGFATAVAAYQALKASELKDEDGNDLPDSRFDRLKYYGKHAGDFGKGVGDLLGAGRDIVDLFNRSGRAPTPDELPSDEDKILAQADDIRAQIEKFRSLPEADEYRKILDQFVELALSRNQKIVTHDAIRLGIDILTSEVGGARKELVVLQREVALGTNPALPFFCEFMTKANRTARSDIVRLLHQAHRAYCYYSLSKQRFSVADQTVDMLRSSQVTILRLLTNAKEAFGRDFQTINGIKVQLSRIVDPRQIEDFRRTGRIVFGIDYESGLVPELRQTSYVKVNSVGVDLVGASRPRAVRAILVTQHGNSAIYDKSHTRRDFLHGSISANCIQNTNGEFLEGSGVFHDRTPNSEYTGVSPFGVWTIAIDRPVKEELRRVRDIVLTFSVDFQPAP
jgi:hypothetical protein